MSMSEAVLYFNKTLLHKSFEWSSLISGPGLNSSPLEAKNPSVFRGSATTFQNAGLDEAQAGIKVAERIITDLRYAYDITLMVESEEELKRLLMKMKEESEKVGLELNIQKTKIMASSPITSWQIDGETMETVTGFILGGLQNHFWWWL